jgi:uncharacterized protein YukE
VALNVKSQDLVTSGIAVTGHGEDVAAKRCIADTQIGTAQVGWQGRPAASISLRLAAWSTTTTQLLTHLTEHAQGLHTCPQEFRAMEERHAETLKEEARHANSIVTRV